MTRCLATLSLVFSVSLADAKERHLPPPDGLSAAARRVIRQRMLDHSNETVELVWQVILLDYPGAEKTATAIAKGMKPLDPDTPELQGVLVPYFFELQDQLRERAARVAEAAHKKDGAELGSAYRLLSETCVSCHVAYLNPPPANPR